MKYILRSVGFITIKIKTGGNRVDGSASLKLTECAAHTTVVRQEVAYYNCLTFFE